MKKMKNNHNLYLKYEVSLLAKVFGKFKNNSLKNYGLFPSRYLGAPALSWNAMLNMTIVDIELTSDAGMYLFFEKVMRRVVSNIYKRYSKVNNKCLKSSYPEKESKHMLCLDTNNLYGYVMYRFLTTSGLKWIDPKEFNLNKYASNSSKGYVLEVTLEYPKESFKLHNDYVLAPDKIEIKEKCCLNTK